MGSELFFLLRIVGAWNEPVVLRPSSLHHISAVACGLQSCDEKCCFIFSLIPSHLLLHRCCLADVFDVSLLFPLTFLCLIGSHWKHVTTVRVSQSPTWLIYCCSACRLPPPPQFFLCCPGNKTRVKWRQSSKLGWHFKWNPTEFTFLQCYMSLHRSIKIKKLLLHDHT